MKNKFYSKKGMSVIIGYILLISFALIISILVYQWAKTYVPAEVQDCPDGSSIYISDYSCIRDGGVYHLNLTFENNGRFNLAGYFIHANRYSTYDVANVDLSGNYTGDSNEIFGNAIVFSTTHENILTPHTSIEHSFDLPFSIASVKIQPIRIQEVNERTQTVSCSQAIINEVINCVE